MKEDDFYLMLLLHCRPAAPILVLRFCFSLSIYILPFLSRFLLTGHLSLVLMLYIFSLCLLYTREY